MGGGGGGGHWLVMDTSGLLKKYIKQWEENYWEG